MIPATAIWLYAPVTVVSGGIAFKEYRQMTLCHCCLCTIHRLDFGGIVWRKTVKNSGKRRKTMDMFTVKKQQKSPETQGISRLYVISVKIAGNCSGAGCRIRTDDLPLTRRVLYQLS